MRHVYVGSIGGGAPLHPAHRAALADTHVPETRAFFIGIERMHDAGFLPRDARSLPMPERDENGRRTEVEIGAVRRAVRRVRQAARGCIRIAGSHLADPELLTRLQIEGHESVARLSGGLAVVIAGSYVHDVAFGV